MRIQYRFDEAGSFNAGFLYAVDETFPRSINDGGVTKGNWPRSIECQMLQGDGGDAFSVQQVAFDTKVTDGKWDPNGKAVKVCEKGCDGPSYVATTDSADYPGPEWNDMEVVVRGADSAFHMVNGQTVFKLFNIRITDTIGTTIIPWDHGAVGLQAENAVIHYRRWEIMELPDTGPNYLERLFLISPKKGIHFQAGATATVTWKSLGNIKKVSIFYNLGLGGEWVMVADNINNTGTYNWIVPEEVTDKLRFRISAAPWVTADSSQGDNSISLVARLMGPRAKGDRRADKDGLIKEKNRTEYRDLKGRVLSPTIKHPLKSAASKTVKFDAR